MPLVSPSIESRDYRAPGTCVLCQQTRTEAANGSMVDTGIDNETPAMTARTGRLYVCDLCVEEMAELYGFVKESSVAKAKGDMAVAAEQLNTVKEDLTAAAENLKSVAESVPTLDV